METLKFSIIVAISDNGVIGNEGGIPWRIKKDMGFFKEITTRGSDNNVVIMGRKTWESIPKKFRPLPERHNIIVTRNPEQAKGLAIDGEIFVIGGQSLYQESLGTYWEALGKLYITQVHKQVQGDTFFPYVNLHDKWEEVHMQVLVEEGDPGEDPIHVCTWRTFEPKSS
jgi:dihydrofolate reductase